MCWQYGVCFTYTLASVKGTVKNAGSLANFAKNPLSKAIDNALQKMRQSKGESIDDLLTKFEKARKSGKTEILDTTSADKQLFESIQRVENQNFKAAERLNTREKIAELFESIQDFFD